MEKAEGGGTDWEGDVVVGVVVMEGFGEEGVSLGEDVRGVLVWVWAVKLRQRMAGCCCCCCCLVRDGGGDGWRVVGRGRRRCEYLVMRWLQRGMGGGKTGRHYAVIYQGGGNRCAG